MKESSFWPGGILWLLRDALAIRILVLLFVKNEQATTSPKNGYLHSALEGNLPTLARTPGHCGVCVRALQYISRGQRTQCVLRPAKQATRRPEAARQSAVAPLSASAWRLLGRLVGNVLGVGHIAVLGHWARRQIDAVAARRIFQSEPSVRGSHRVTQQRRSVTNNAP